MQFPSIAYVAKAFLIAAILAILGYVLAPADGIAGNRGDAALFLALGAVIGSWLSALTRAPGNSTSVAEGDTQTVFVGNLAFKATDEDLRTLFSPYGPVQSTRIMRDRKTRRPRGYGFVEMPVPQARKAIQALDGKEFHGRKLRVKEGNRKDAENGD